MENPLKLEKFKKFQQFYCSMEEKEILQKLFGLSEKEAVVYLKLLELGEATIRRISETTGINRFTLYDVLKYLIEKELAGMIIKEKVKQFYVIEPKELLRRIKEAEKKFSSIVSELEKRKAIVGVKPKIMLFEGKKGIDAVNEDVLKSREIFAYGSFEVVSKTLKWQAIDFVKKRLKLGIKWKGVTDSSIKKTYFYKDPKYKKLTELRIDDSLKDMQTWNYIYNNKIAILSFKKENFVGIIIEDEAVSNSYRIVFEKLWNQANRKA